jgi:hypothetical protein
MNATRYLPLAGHLLIGLGKLGASGPAARMSPVSALALVGAVAVELGCGPVLTAGRLLQIAALSTSALGSPRKAG